MFGRFVSKCSVVEHLVQCSVVSTQAVIVQRPAVRIPVLRPSPLLVYSSRPLTPVSVKSPGHQSSGTQNAGQPRSAAAGVQGATAPGSAHIYTLWSSSGSIILECPKWFFGLSLFHVACSNMEGSVTKLCTGYLMVPMVP